MSEASILNNSNSAENPLEAHRPATTTCPCARHAALKPLLTIICCLAAAAGSLLVAEIPYDTEDLLCGIWGCYPPLQALAAIHLFWCVVLSTGVCVIRGWKPHLLQPVGILLLLVAVMAIVAIVGNDLTRWFQRYSPSTHSFWPQRVAYTIATTSDVPLIQSFLAGTACLVLSYRRRKKLGLVSVGLCPT
jgi:hypothetical protein